MPGPWRDRALLAPLAAAWSAQARGRALFRTMTGPGWLSLHLVGDDRAGLVLGALPGAVLAFPLQGALPRPLRDALEPVRRDPLHDLLRDATLDGLALLANDLVLVIDLRTGRARREIRLQLFGSRGGCVVLDPDAGRVLWTAHPGPHPCLVAPDAPRQDPPPPAHDDDLASWAVVGLQHLAGQRRAALADRLARRLERRRASAGRLVENLAADLARADGGQERRRDAETLAASLHQVARGTATITLPDPHDGSPRELTLDPALAPHENLERLFHRARKAERGREQVATRLEAARTDLAAVEAAAARWRAVLGADDESSAASDPVAAIAAILDFGAAERDLLDHGPTPRDGQRTRSPDEPARPFRRYRIDGRWEVWVGRSSEENDTLTHRASHPRDLWLHAQGVAGSHVIVRTGGRPDTVPRPVLEKAAALAALHSKARNSALVPVIWTERRYVRRPRKAAPGTAVCLREQNLFVEPGVMAGVDPA
jgi:hypothetical protein